MSPSILQLSKTISFILRHNPHLFELELDAEGWLSVDMLLDALYREKPAFGKLSLADLEQLIAMMDKQRFQIENGQIRALYGHSLATKLKKTPAIPPAILYHGTSESVLATIMSDGLRPMSRQYVHCSVDKATAILVGRRKKGALVLLQVNAARASADGIVFYEGNPSVWLADFIPAQYLSMME